VELDDKLVKRIQDIKISFGYTPRELFGDRMLTAIIRPPIQFPVCLTSIGNLCTLVAEVLHNACKIPPPTEEIDDSSIAFDDETLKWVTSLQLEAKIYTARVGSPFCDTNLEKCDRVRRTIQLLPRALTPLAVCIDQIGKFLVQDQPFIPVPNGTEDFLYDQLFQENNSARVLFRAFVAEEGPGIVMNTRNHLGQRLRAVPNDGAREQLLAAGIVDEAGNFSAGFIATPYNYPYVGLVDFIPERDPPVVPTFSEIVRRYVELEGRIGKKLANVFVEVELDKGLGVESQLVYRSISQDGTCSAWSPRVIRADALEVGSVLGLGYPDWSMASKNVAACMCTVDLSAGLECMANILTKKMR
jgi:hypothetical protein